MASMAAAASSSAITSSSSRELASFSGLKSTNGAAGLTFSGQRVASLASKGAVSNGSRLHCMLVWTPYDNKKYETLSYLPQLNDDQVAKQVDYITRKGWIPCLEFSNAGSVYREHFHGSGYYDGRYWTMWKLPMFGCTDASLVLKEIGECRKAYPKAFIRVLGFDRKRQVQVSGFLVHKP